MSSPEKTYRDQLIHRGYGYPLWNPNPHQEPPVELADVGYIKHGKFLKLFNARLPLSDPSNRFGVPPNHTPLTLQEYQLESIPSLPFFLSSHTCSETGADGGMTANTSTPIGQFGGGGGFSFTRSKDMGALLCMGAPAERAQVRNEKTVQDYALAHYKFWHEFAVTQGISVGPEELRIVTGCDKTSDWACAAWSKTSGSGSIGFNANLPSIQGQARIWGRWETSDSIDYRAGPERLIESNPRPRSAPEPETSSGRRTEPITSLMSDSRIPNAIVNNKNQCVFVRGYIVVERIFLLKPQTKNKMGFEILEKPRFIDLDKNRPSSFPSGDPSQGGPSSSAKDSGPSDTLDTLHDYSDYSADGYGSDADTSVEHDLSLIDVMIEYIFKNSEAALVLFHDEDVRELIQGGSDPPFHTDVNYRQWINEKRPEVYMDGQVGMFSRTHRTRNQPSRAEGENEERQARPGGQTQCLSDNSGSDSPNVMSDASEPEGFLHSRGLSNATVDIEDQSPTAERPSSKGITSSVLDVPRPESSDSASLHRREYPASEPLEDSLLLDNRIRQLKPNSRRASRSEDLTGQVRVLKAPGEEYDWIVNCGTQTDVLKGTYNNTYVAIKRFRRPINDINPDTIYRRLMRESHVWLRVMHENVLSHLGYCTDIGPCVALVSPFCQHGSIMEYISKNSSTDRPALLKDVTKGLHYLHSNNIVHADIHPNKVLISDDGRAMLAGFGRAKVLGGLGFDIHDVAGCAAYMAPELFPSDDDINVDKMFSKESDVYAYAMLCQKVLTGTDPFAGYNVKYVHQIAALIMNHRRPIRTDQIPITLWNMMESCWEVSPMKRPSTARILQLIDQ